MRRQADGARSNAKGPGLRVARAGCVSSFRVHAHDSNGERLEWGGDNITSWVTGMKHGPTVGQVADNTDGSYSVSYLADGLEPGRTAALHVTVNGVALPGSPFRPSVMDGCLAARSCTASGPCLYDGVAGEPCEIVITARDCNDNPLHVGGAVFQTRIRALRPACNQYDGWCESFDERQRPTDLGDGRYLLSWSAPVAAVYSLEVTLDRTHIRGSPFTCTLVSPFAQPPPELRWAPLGGETASGPIEGTAVAAAAAGGQIILAGKMAPQRATLALPSLHFCQPACLFESESAKTPPRLPLKPRERLLAPPRDYRFRGRVLCDLRLRATREARPQSAPNLGLERPLSAARPATRPWSANPWSVTRPRSPALVAASSGGGASRGSAMMPLDVISCEEGGYFLFAVTARGYALDPRAIAGRVATREQRTREQRTHVAVCRLVVNGGFEAQPANPTPLLTTAPTESAPEARVGACAAVTAAPLLLGSDLCAASQAVDAFAEVSGVKLHQSATRQAVWLFGGEGVCGLSNELWRFDVDTHIWRQVACAHGPSARSHAAMAQGADGALWMLGGRTPDGASSEIWRFDPSSEEWEQPEVEGYPPTARYGHSLVRVLGRYLLACGGMSCSGAGRDEEQEVTAEEVALLDVSRREWHLRTASPPLRARRRPVAAYVCGRHLLFSEATPTSANGGTARGTAGAVVPLALQNGDFVQHGCLQLTGDPSQYALVKMPPVVGAAIGAGGFTVEAWVMPVMIRPGGPPSMIICKGDASTKQSFGLYAQPSDDGNGVNLCAFVGGLGKNQLAARSIPTGRWVRLTATYDAAGGAFALYRDGCLVDSGSASVGGKDLAGRGETDLFLGASPSRGGFHGSFDQAALWSRPLLLSEVQAGQGALPARGRDSGLLGLWTFDEGAGTVCFDTRFPAGRGRGSRLDGQLEGGAERAASTRQLVEPECPPSSSFKADKAAELEAWRAAFCEKHGRPATKADLLMADSDVLKLARLLGEL